MILGRCHFCGDDVLDGQAVAWPVRGWEAERAQGGANRIIGRERVRDGRVAHVHCSELDADRGRRGLHREQANLL
ncbi:MAG: hypothetical protein L3J91_03040 [Thermoplasmata archaeon]|nr:hypothetical protein [Thermoplasmata archaeon]